MDPMFLSQDITVDISIKSTVTDHPTGAKIISFDITGGGPYRIRTATGREYGKIQQAVNKGDVDACYDLAKQFLVGGVEKSMIEKLHPDVIFAVLIEVLSRSRVTGEQLGK